jgi:hypothetical protein
MSRTVGLPPRTMGVHGAWLSPTRLAKSLPWAGIALEQPFSILRNPPLIAHQLPSATDFFLIDPEKRRKYRDLSMFFESKGLRLPTGPDDRTKRPSLFPGES